MAAGEFDPRVAVAYRRAWFTQGALVRVSPKSEYSESVSSAPAVRGLINYTSPHPIYIQQAFTTAVFLLGGIFIQ